LDIKKRIEDLEAALKQWKAVNSSSPYDDVQIKSHIASMELEIKATQTRLDAVKGMLVAIGLLRRDASTYRSERRRQRLSPCTTA